MRIEASDPVQARFVFSRPIFLTVQVACITATISHIFKYLNENLLSTTGEFPQTSFPVSLLFTGREKKRTVWGRSYSIGHNLV